MDDPAEDNRAQAEQLNLQAGFRYNKIRAHLKVYGSRNAEVEQLARYGIEFIEAALKLFPDDPNYLNTYALLVADGLGQKKLGLEILEKAARLAPNNIQISQNIRDLNASAQAGCLVLCFAGLASGYAFARLFLG